MIRVAFTFIDRMEWIGGYNYLLNLFRVLRDFGGNAVQPVLFVQPEAEEADLAPFRDVLGDDVRRSAVLNKYAIRRRLPSTLLLRRDIRAGGPLRAHAIDLMFEAATFYGPHPGRPVVSWIPDFQHHYIRGSLSRWKWFRREMGYRAQTARPRHIMVSSEDARADCEKFYPKSRGRIHVVRFAVRPTFVEPAAIGEVVERLGVPPRFFLIPNQYWPHKNHEIVVSALGQLREAGHTDVHVVTTGDTKNPHCVPQYEKIQGMVADAGIRAQYHALGQVRYADLVHLMHGALAIVNPSRFEGWSTIVEDAKANGLPLVLSDLAVHREQSPERARFFAADDPAALAEALCDVSEGEREPLADRDRLTAEADERLRAFARDFVTMIRQVVQV